MFTYITDVKRISRYFEKLRQTDINFSDKNISYQINCGYVIALILVKTEIEKTIMHQYLRQRIYEKN
jgi:hypothetical protein